MDYSLVFSQQSQQSFSQKRALRSRTFTINKQWCVCACVWGVIRKMVNEVLYCGYANIRRVHCALGCVHILLTLLFLYCALRAHLRCRRLVTTLSHYRHLMTGANDKHCNLPGLKSTMARRQPSSVLSMFISLILATSSVSTRSKMVPTPAWWALLRWTWRPVASRMPSFTWMERCENPPISSSFQPGWTEQEQRCQHVKSQCNWICN